MSDQCFHGRNAHSCELCQQPKTETDNDTQCELAAWELLKEARQELEDYKTSAKRARDTITQAFLKVAEERDEARELARELRDVLALLISDLPRNRDWLNPDTEKIARVILTKAKEVLP